MNTQRMAFEHPNGPQRALDRGDREKIGRIRVNKIASLRPVDIGQNSVAMLEALRAGARYQDDNLWRMVFMPKQHLSVPGGPQGPDFPALKRLREEGEAHRCASRLRASLS